MMVDLEFKKIPSIPLQIEVSITQFYHQLPKRANNSQFNDAEGPKLVECDD